MRSSLGLLVLVMMALLPFSSSPGEEPPAASKAAAKADEAQIDVIVEDEDAKTLTIPPSLTMRVRIVRLKPFAPTQIQYKYGGWGSNGTRVYGHFWKPKEPDKPTTKQPAGDSLDDLLNQTPTTAKAKPAAPKTELQPPATVDFHGRKFVEKPPLFELNEWTEQVPLEQFAYGGATNPRFLQVFAGSGGVEEGRHVGGDRRYVGAAKDFVVELEFAYEGKLLKKLTVAGPDAPIAPIVIPYGALVGKTKPTDAAFLDNLTSLETYTARRANWAESQPWSSGPKPKHLAMVTNLGGYGESHALGIRHADQAIIEDEARTLRAMGINGFQGGPSYLVEQAMRHEGIGAPFRQGADGAAHGYPVPKVTENNVGDDAGCPFDPKVPAAKRAAAAQAVKELREHRGMFLLQGTTADEIGVVVDYSKQGKAHLTTCPHCRRGFHEYLRREGLKPADFGASDWSELAPLMIWKTGQQERPWLTDKHQAMLAFWTRRFNNYSSAQLFSELRNVARAENAKKRAALAVGDTTSDVAMQPWHYPGAMRGNSFLMGGHSLDFFEFYREADNAFVYETSNRDPRVWSWDSYLCDVGRIVTAQPDMGQELFGVYVKPHRGAGMQRGLTAVSRGAEFINWYTYGPPYAKGDDWGARPDMMSMVGRSNQLIAAAEDVIYGGQWAQPAQIAIVKPNSLESWLHLTDQSPLFAAAWENAKWVYTALTHAHLPVDPIDETMLRQIDLAKYRVIYVNSPTLERAAAEKLSAWVRQGGTLVTMGYGLARDEYNQPLDVIQPALGLARRTEPQMWHATKTYGATALKHYDKDSRIGDPPAVEAATVKGSGSLAGEYPLTVGREVLQPASDAETLARYADGGAAFTRHKFGQGEAYVLGYFAGLEYVVPLMTDRYHMQRDFDATRRSFIVAPALAKISPVVDTSQPTVEGVLIKHPKSGQQIVTLMNWAYGVTAVREIHAAGRATEKPIVSHLPAENLQITLRGAGNVSRVRSLVLKQDLAVRAAAEGATITLSKLDEGDILLINP